MATMLRRAHIYLAENKPAIVSAMHHNAVGIYYEQDSPLVLQQWRNAETLAQALKSSLERFSFQERNLRNDKLTDWPAYQACGLRSVSDFERIYLRINVQALNEAELSYDAFALPPGEDEISLHVTLNRDGSNEELGQKLLRLFDLCSTWNDESALADAQ